MSQAGKREGLAGERSGLFMEMIRVIKEMRDATNGEYPKFAIWENVCFEGNTLITCESGYKNIKDVCIGDRVKTLSGKFLPVVKTYRTDSVNTIKIHVSGGEDIVCTENHPFYAREKIYTGKIRNISEPKWVCAGELTKNHLVAYRLDEPSLPENFISKEEAWALGRYIADGSVDLKKNIPRIFISVGDYKIDEARVHLYKLPYDIYENKPHSTATNFVFSSSQFYSLVSKVGIGAGNKQIPPFVFELPISLQKEVLNGYCCGDGYIRNRGNTRELTASTASRTLAYGVARLIRNVYHIAANISVYPPKNGCINGRILKANYPNYVINACLTTKMTLSIYEDNIMWQPVKGVVKNGKVDVYNLSVMEDNTYGANDVFVHNCGAFSSNKGEDFRCVLERFARIVEPDVSIPRPSGKNGKWSKSGAISGNGWSLAWRLFDAQYWGVPQRRQRIALVMDFRGQRAAEILFERTGVPGNPDESIPTWQSFARITEECTAKDDRVVGEKSFCIVGNMIDRETNMNGTGIKEDTAFTINTIDRNAVAYTLKIRSGCEGGGKGALVQTEKSATLSTLQDQTLICLADNTSLHNLKQKICVLNDQGGSVMNVSYDIVGTIRAQEHGHQPIVFESHSQDARYTQQGNTSPACTAQWGTGGNNMPLVAEKKAFAMQRIGEYKESEQASTMKSRDYKDATDLIAEKKTKNLQWIVRRLTPVECERLQGFPDGWTDIGEWVDENGKKHKPADSPRYKALGNSIALPQWYWIFQKMKPYIGENPTLGSLFDGIGGFPLVFESTYGDGTAIWGSEIEPFCVAVTKKHFPEKQGG